MVDSRYADSSPIPLLELDLLRTLVAICEAGNFSAAAEVVHRTPSAVSVQVKRIEGIVGRPVFTRDSRSVALTTDGEPLLAHARRVLALNREVLGHFRTSEISGVVRLGAIDHAAEQFLPELLRRFAETHPGVSVDVLIENSAELTKRVRRKKLDLAIVTCDAASISEPAMEPLMSEPLVWAGVKGGIAQEQDPLPVSVWEARCMWRQAALEGLEAQGRDYRITFMSAHIAGQKAAVLADMAVAPLPVSACTGRVIALGTTSGLPTLPDCALGMFLGAEQTELVRSLADHLRASLSDASAIGGARVCKKGNRVRYV